MTQREIRIGTVAASLAALLGIGVTMTVVGAGEPETHIDSFKVFECEVSAKTETYRIDETDAGELVYVPVDAGAPAPRRCIEVCGYSGNAGNVTTIGCESGHLPASLEDEVTTITNKAKNFWENRRGVK